MNGNFETSLNLSWAIVAILMIVVVPLGVLLLLEARAIRGELREARKAVEEGEAGVLMSPPRARRPDGSRDIST